MVAGLAFLVLVWSARHPQGNGLTAFWWFVLAYFVLEVGELLLSPCGLAAVTELSVRSAVGVLMGAWGLGNASSEALAALLGQRHAAAPPMGGPARPEERRGGKEGVWPVKTGRSRSP